MYTRVVAPQDGSILALQALPYARMIAASTGAALTLVRAVNTPPADIIRMTASSYGEPETSSATVDRWAEARARIADECRRQLEEAAGPARAQGLNVELVVREGAPADVVNEEADRDPGALIAMSTHGRSGVGRWLMGSVTDSVVRHGRHATLVVRPHEGDVTSASPRLRRVVLPVDGSAVSESALEHAAAMAQALGCGVTVLRAISPIEFAEGFADYVPAAQNAAFAAEVRAEAEAYLDAKAAALRDAGVADVNGKVAHGSPSAAILDEVGEGGERMVVMATHGRTGAARMLMGSVTDRVIRHSPGPVLVIRPQ